MASTYTSNKVYLEKPANGDQVGAWDVPVNANWTDIDKGFGGSATAAVTSGDWTLSDAEAKNLVLIPTAVGTLAANRNVILPATRGGFWIIYHAITLGSYTVTVKPASGTGVTIPSGSSTLIWSDGSTARYADNGLYVTKTGDTMTGTLACASNGLTVGTTQLAVSGGNVSMSGDLTVGGSITATGNITAYSDARFKEDVVTIQNAVELVRRLRGVRYRMHDRKNVGVIAQEVETVLPEVVATDSDGFKSVAYGNMVGILIEAVKELSARVEYLEKRK